jgi:hypothetical protein
MFVAVAATIKAFRSMLLSSKFTKNYSLFREVKTNRIYEPPPKAAVPLAL